MNSLFHCKVAVLALQVRKCKFFCSIQDPKIKCQSSSFYSEPEDNCFWSFTQFFSITTSPAWHQCEETHSHFLGVLNPKTSPSMERPQQQIQALLLLAKDTALSLLPSCLFLGKSIFPIIDRKATTSASQSCASPLRSCHPFPRSPQVHSDWAVITIGFSSKASLRFSIQIMLWKVLRPWEPRKACLLTGEILRYLSHSYTFNSSKENIHAVKPSCNEWYSCSKVKVIRRVRDANSQHQTEHISLVASTLLLSPLVQNRKESSCRSKIKM